MTVQSTTRKAGPFLGNGVTTAFPFDFKIFQASDVRVILADAAGVESTLTLNSDYSMVVNADQDANPGGTVTYPGPPILPTNFRLTILGAMPLNQLTDITNVGRFNPDVVERMADKNTILIQQLYERSERSVLVPVSSDSSPATLIAELIGAASDADAAADAAAAAAGVAATQAGNASAAATAAGVQAGNAATEAANAATSAAGAAAAATTQVNLFKTDVANSTNVALGAALVGFKSGAAGSVGRTLAAKLSDRLSVKDFGAIGDGVADDTAAIQTAMNYVAGVGGELFFPTGKYRTTATLTLTMNAASDSSQNRVHLRGAGAGNTSIIAPSGVGVLRVLSAGADFTTYWSIQGLRLQGTGMNAIGLEIQKAAWFQVRDVVVRGCSFGIFGQDILSCLFDSCNLRGCLTGMQAQRGTASFPNAITLLNCEVGLNEECGAIFAGASTLSVIGGAFEGNGWGLGATTQQCGLVILNNNGAVALEGAGGANIQGTYFEYNNGGSDLYFSSGGLDGSTSLNVSGCTFNRISNVVGRFVTNNIRVDVGSTVTSKTSVSVTGCGFCGINTYVANSARRYIAINGAGAPWNFTDGGANLYVNPIEKPVIVGPTRTGRAMASANVVFNGTTGAINGEPLNVASVVRNAAGSYTINFQKAMTSVNYAAAISINGLGVGYVFGVTTTALEIRTTNMASAATDFSFIGVTVHGAAEIV